jgi:disulfide bond formation protein DsbB
MEVLGRSGELLDFGQCVTQNAGDLLDDLNTQHGPSCTDATLRVLGLSFAGWNVICSLVLAVIGIRCSERRKG